MSWNIENKNTHAFRRHRGAVNVIKLQIPSVVPLIIVIKLLIVKVSTYVLFTGMSSILFCTRELSDL
jgi:hypothetical protein